MSVEPEQDFEGSSNIDSDVLHEILDILHQHNLTVSGAQCILRKALNATTLIPFQWNPNNRIPEVV